MTAIRNFTEATFDDELKLSRRIIERFIESCSHELKSPLCSIEGILTIASKYETAEEVTECHRMISRCVDQMKLMLVSLEQYTLHLQRDMQHNQISATKLIGKILDENANDIRERGVELKVDVDQQVKWISDESCSYIILQNVIKNAVVFNDITKAAPKVSIGVVVNERFAGIQIKDNGIGISAQEQTRLFEPFHRASNLKGGLGLGLFLVKGMVNKLCANICISSHEDIGTTVSLLIPNHL